MNEMNELYCDWCCEEVDTLYFFAVSVLNHDSLRTFVCKRCQASVASAIKITSIAEVNILIGKKEEQYQ